MNEFKYVVRLKQRDKDGRMLRRIGRHPNLTAAYASAVEKFGAKNISSVRIAASELK